MTLAERIARGVQQLPPEAQAEVLDFIEFMALRSRRVRRELSERERADGDSADEAFERLADAEDPVTYTLADCREGP